MTTRKPSAKQLSALLVVAEGRVQYGSEFPERERRSAARGGMSISQTWLIDGVGAYGAEHATWLALEDRGWIKVRHDLIPSKRVPESTREYTSISGAKTVSVLPAHDEPEDPGWRAAVELTPDGAAILERYRAHTDRPRNTLMPSETPPYRRRQVDLDDRGN